MGEMHFFRHSVRSETENFTHVARIELIKARLVGQESVERV